MLGLVLAALLSSAQGSIEREAAVPSEFVAIFLVVEMVKIDFNLVGETASHVNPLREHELTLSALRIPAIENLALTRDMNDTINLVRCPHLLRAG